MASPVARNIAKFSTVHESSGSTFVDTSTLLPPPDAQMNPHTTDTLALPTKVSWTATNTCLLVFLVGSLSAPYFLVSQASEKNTDWMLPSVQIPSSLSYDARVGPLRGLAESVGYQLPLDIISVASFDDHADTRHHVFIKIEMNSSLPYKIRGHLKFGALCLGTSSKGHHYKFHAELL